MGPQHRQPRLEPHVKALPAQGAAGVILQTSNSDLAPDAGANPARLGMGAININ